MWVCMLFALSRTLTMSVSLEVCIYMQLLLLCLCLCLLLVHPFLCTIFGQLQNYQTNQMESNDALSVAKNIMVKWCRRSRSSCTPCLVRIYFFALLVRSSLMMMVVVVAFCTIFLLFSRKCTSFLLEDFGILSFWVLVYDSLEERFLV